MDGTSPKNSNARTTETGHTIDIADIVHAIPVSLCPRSGHQTKTPLGIKGRLMRWLAGDGLEYVANCNPLQLQAAEAQAEQEWRQSVERQRKADIAEIRQIVAEVEGLERDPDTGRHHFFYPKHLVDDPAEVERRRALLRAYPQETHEALRVEYADRQRQAERGQGYEMDQ